MTLEQQDILMIHELITVDVAIRRRLLGPARSDEKKNQYHDWNGISHSDPPQSGIVRSEEHRSSATLRRHPQMTLPRREQKGESHSKMPFPPQALRLSRPSLTSLGPITSNRTRNYTGPQTETTNPSLNHAGESMGGILIERHSEDQVQRRTRRRDPENLFSRSHAPAWGRVFRDALRPIPAALDWKPRENCFAGLGRGAERRREAFPRRAWERGENRFASFAGFVRGAERRGGAFPTRGEESMRSVLAAGG